jgi:hypothetical protein
VTLDFGRGFPVGQIAAQFSRLPLELIRECAGLGVGVELSVYVVD